MFLNSKLHSCFLSAFTILICCLSLQPPSGQAGGNEPNHSSDPIWWQSTSADGSSSYTWLPPTPNTDEIGSIGITANRKGRTAKFRLNSFLRTDDRAVRFVRCELAGNPNERRLIFSDRSTSLVLTIRFRISEQHLLIALEADKPLISALHISSVLSEDRGQKLALPYYSEPIFQYEPSGLFVSIRFEWQHSDATRLTENDAVYEPLTDGKRNRLRETLVLAIADRLADVLPAIENSPSPYRQRLAGRIVLDIWTQSNFSQITQALSALAEAGVKDCVVLIHNWQRGGYDNALPNVYPANASQGGNDQLARAIAIGRGMGCYVALHENYADLYPNSGVFSNNRIALNTDGTPVKAWFNKDAHVQSYATKQLFVLEEAEAQSPKIRGGLNTNASFVDVNSASSPWFHIDMDATQKGAGMFSTAVAANKGLWNYERQTFGGPVFGEGLEHWYWSGLLDGVEAQLGAGGFKSTAEHTPLFVDFDLLKIHPLQINHGMGMYERWMTAGETMTQTILLDAYRMQELIYGHAPYSGGTFWENVWQVLQEQKLVSPVAQRYGSQAVSSISYQVRNVWGHSTAAIEAKDWSRVAVKYANGDTILANAQPQILMAGALRLPQYGWAAQGKDLLAYTALVNGLIADYAQTEDSYFANARNASDRALAQAVARPRIMSFSQTGNRSAIYEVQWQVLNGAHGANLNNFVHFVDNTGNIALQIDYVLATPTAQWKPGQVLSNSIQLSIPQNFHDGSYSMRIGLYSAQSGLRVHAEGVDDGSLRYILGTVVVSNQGASVTFEPQGVPPSPVDSRLNTTGAIVDFTTLRTDGMVSLQRDGDRWVLRAYPRYRNVVAQLREAQFPLPSSITCDSTLVAAPPVVHGYWQLPTKGVSVCSWPAKVGQPYTLPGLL